MLSLLTSYTEQLPGLQIKTLGALRSELILNYDPVTFPGRSPGHVTDQLKSQRLLV